MKITGIVAMIINPIEVFGTLFKAEEEEKQDILNSILSHFIRIDQNQRIKNQRKFRH